MVVTLSEFEINDLVSRILRASLSNASFRVTDDEFAWIEAHPLKSGELAVRPSGSRDETQGLMIASRMMETA